MVGTSVPPCCHAGHAAVLCTLASQSRAAPGSLCFCGIVWPGHYWGAVCAGPWQVMQMARSGRVVSSSELHRITHLVCRAELLFLHAALCSALGAV